MTDYWYNTEKTTVHILGENHHYLCGMERMPKHARVDAGWVADRVILLGVTNEEIDARLCERCRKKKLALIHEVAAR